MKKILPRFHSRIARFLGAELRERLPDFFIVGAARSGTTSLWQYLNQHPQLFLPTQIVDKEPSYFCQVYGVTDRSKYLSIFAGAGDDQLIGEASTPYLSSPDSADWIAREAPSAKIIITLRNPADRAYSLYKWMRENGYEQCESFQDAIWAEDHTRADSEAFRSRNPQYYYNYLYYRTGEYAEQVQRYFNAFGRDQVRVYFFEEMVKEPSSTVRDICGFLGVDPEFEPEVKIHNPTFEGAPYDETLRRELLVRYAPSIERLQQLLARDLSAIWR